MQKLWLCLAILLIAFPTIAQDTLISDALIAQLEHTEARVSELRELESLGPLLRDFPSKEEMIAYIEAVTFEELTDDIIYEETLFYRAFDFVTDDFDLVALYLELLADQVAGFYDPETRTMNVILLSGGVLGDALPILERVTYAHEYAHALQDQYFDLAPMYDAVEATHESDRILAAVALVEGDASLVMQEYTMVLGQEEPGTLLALLGASLTTDTSLPEGTPDILIEELMMPYLQGMVFVNALKTHGGWDYVNAAFAAPPVSTEQIFHPQAYINNELPIEVTLTDKQALLGDGWTLVLERTFGEFYWREYLATQLTNRVAQSAAAGWGGDRFQIYHNQADDEIAWVMRVAWDTVEDGAQFSDAYELFLSTRLPESTTDGENIRCREDSNETFCFIHNGHTLISYAPTITLARDLLYDEESKSTE